MCAHLAELHAAVRQVLHTLAVMGHLLTDFMYLVIPGIVGVVERTELPVVVRRHAVDCLGRLCRDLHVSGQWLLAPSGALAIMFLTGS